MIRTLGLFVAALPALLLAAPASGQSLVVFDPVGPQGSGQPVVPITVAPGITASDLDQEGFGGWGNTNVWPVGQIGVAQPTVDLTRYVFFSITSAAPVELESLSYSRLSYTGDSCRAASVRTSLDSFASDVAVVTGIAPTGLAQLDFDLSGLAPITGSVELRIYFYDAPVAGADWVDLLSTAAGGTGLVLTAAPGTLGTPYCTATPNSTGSPGEISAIGSSIAADNDVTLLASNLPPFRFGIFVTSKTQSFVPNVGSGNLCLGGVIGRYQQPSQIVQVDANGEFSLRIDTTAMPQGVGLVPIVVGETWNFQAWHRDFMTTAPPTNTSNLTNGVSILFS